MMFMLLFHQKKRNSSFHDHFFLFKIDEQKQKKIKSHPTSKRAQQD